MTRGDRKKIAQAILGRHYVFLLASAKEETKIVVDDFISSWTGKDMKEFSNALQRALYLIARSKGFRRVRGGGWTDFPLGVSRRKLLRAALRKGHLWWLRQRLSSDDWHQEEELCLLETAGIKFIRPFFRAVGRHFYQVARAYGFTRPRLSPRYVRFEVLVDRYPDETFEEALDRRKAGESPFGRRRVNRKTIPGVPRRNRAFWLQVRARTTNEEWARLWEWAKNPASHSAPDLVIEVRRRLSDDT